jgi:hypothetical protein
MCDQLSSTPMASWIKETTSRSIKTTLKGGQLDVSMSNASTSNGMWKGWWHACKECDYVTMVVVVPKLNKAYYFMMF